MDINILKDYDEAYRVGRAKIIEENYSLLVEQIHLYFQDHIINLIAPRIKIKEIVKFDYMTNLKISGDRHMWINFINIQNTLHYFEVIKYLPDKESIFFDKNPIDSSILEPSAIETLAKECLKVFHRGYDKPEASLL